MQDRAGATLVLDDLHPEFPLLGLVRVDGGSKNSVDQSLVRWAAGHEGVELVAVPRQQVLPRRSVGAALALVGLIGLLVVITVAVIRLRDPPRRRGRAPPAPIETETAHRLGDDLDHNS